MAKQDALQTSGLSGDSAAQRQAQVNDTNDFDLSNVPTAKGGAQVTKAPAEGAKPTLTGLLPKTKRASFADKAGKEDPKMLAKLADQNQVAGKFNGQPAFIDGYLRIQKRRYGSRGQYGIISKGYMV
jgi:hypothetical protein